METSKQAPPGKDAACPALASEQRRVPSAPDQTAFPRLPAETPRAFFDLGHTRSLQAVAHHLGEKLDSIKKWSSRFRWADRIHSFDAGLLQQAAADESRRRSEAAADWARRTAHYREHEWQLAQKLMGAVECYLDDFSDRDVEKMTLAQISRAFQIASSSARSNLSGSLASERPAMAPIQIELTAALKKAYGQPTVDAPSLPAAVTGSSAEVPAHSPSPPLKEERAGEEAIPSQLSALN